MADAVFLLRLQFGGGAAVFGQIKMRVVAEAVFACRLHLPLPRPNAFGNDGLRVRFVPHQHQHANVIAISVIVPRQKFGHFGIIGRIRFRIIAGKPCRQHARRAAQSAHANAAVVRQCGQAAVFGGKPRLGQCVFHKRAVRLGAFFLHKLRLRQDVDMPLGKQCVEFF